MSPVSPASPPGEDAAARLWRLVEIWLLAVDDLVALVEDLEPADALAPTDLPGWHVADTVAHVAHLEAVLAGAPELDTEQVPPADHLRRPMQWYTEAGVLARRGRLLPELAEEVRGAVATRYAELRADPPTDPSAPPPRTLGGMPWDIGTLLRNRPFDVWLHEQDVRRAVGRPGGYDGAPARHAVSVLVAALPMVVGKRLAPPPRTAVRLELPEAGIAVTVAVGEDGRAGFADVPPTTTVRLGTEDFVVLAAGRREPKDTTPVVEGDLELAARLLGSLAVTP